MIWYCHSRTKQHITAKQARQNNATQCHEWDMTTYYSPVMKTGQCNTVSRMGHDNIPQSQQVRQDNATQCHEWDMTTYHNRTTYKFSVIRIVHCGRTKFFHEQICLQSGCGKVFRVAQIYKFVTPS